MRVFLMSATNSTNVIKKFLFYSRKTIDDIQNRHKMFLDLEKPITELHDMFLDIAPLIEGQDEVINRVGKFSANSHSITCCFLIVLVFDNC